MRGFSLIVAILVLGVAGTAAGTRQAPRATAPRVLGTSTATVRLSLPRSPKGTMRIELRRQRTGASRWRVFRLAPTRTRFVDRKLRTATRYRYQLRTCGRVRCSRWSRVAAATTRPAPPAPGSGPTLAGCPVFPADDDWNRDISADPVDPDSARYLGNAIAGAEVHLDLGSTEQQYGIPYTIVPADQPTVPITFGTGGADYGDESDKGPMPIPSDVHIEGGTTSAPNPSGGDRHVLVLQQETCALFELFNTVRTPTGFRVSSAARFDLRRRQAGQRPRLWTSADAAGLAILPGLLRFDEASSGEIRHALRVTVPRVQKAFVSPASHYGPVESTGCLPYGARLRLKATFDETPYRGPALAIVRALKRYGLMLADQGSPLYVTGTSNPGFAGAIEQIHGEHPIPASAFELVRLPAIDRGYAASGGVAASC